MITDRPIPDFAEPDAREVAIRDCGEAVVRLLPGDRIHVHAAYHARGFATAGPWIFLRKGVVDALHSASMRLPKGTNLLVYDGLRSLATQKEIADRFALQLAQLPISDAERAATIARFVAPLPATEAEYRFKPPAHSTGAAVDVGLVGDDGESVDLGADFDQFDEAASTRYYEKDHRSADHSAVDRMRRDQRRLLYWAMIEAGFAPYSAEYWHFELGTKRAAAFHGQVTARYGAVAPWPATWTTAA